MSKTFTVDYETNDLFFKYFFDLRSKEGKFTNKDLSRVFEAFEHVSPIQVGVNAGGDTWTQHLDLLDIKSSTPKVNRVGNKTYRDKTHSLENLKAYLSTKESKMAGQPKKTSDYLKDLGSGHISRGDRTVYVKDDFYVSKFSEEHFMGVGARDKLAAIRRMRVSEEAMEKFVTSTASPKNGVYKNVFSIMTDLLDGATQSSPAKFQAWNATFDFLGTLAFLEKGGHSSLVMQTLNAYNTGALKVVHMEEGWQKMAYGLSRENPSAFKNLITRNDPNAVAALGDWNKSVRNFKEFQYSTMPWGQDFLSKKLFPWVKGMQDQIHFAGPDVNISLTLQKTNNKWAELAIGKAQAAGFSVSSVEDIWSLPGENKFVTEALEEVIQKMGVGPNRPTATQFIKRLSGEVDKAHFFQTRGQGSRLAASASGGGGGRAVTNIFGGGLGGGGWKKLAKYSGLGLSMAVLIGGTYTNDREETQASRFNFNISTKGATRIGNIQRGPATGEPNIISSPMDNLIVPGMITAGLITAAGAGAARRMPGYLGYKYTKPVGYKAGLNEGFKTFRFGMQKIEEAVPLTRVFNVSSMIGSVFGTRPLQQSVAKAVNNLDFEELAGRGYIFNTIEDGRVINTTNTKLANLDRFMEAAIEANPENAAWIRETLRPSEIAGQRGNITKRSVTIGHTGSGINKRTIISRMDDIPEGISQGRKVGQSIEVDVRTSIAQMRRHTRSGEKIVNPIAFAVGRANEILQGRHDKVDFNRYLSFQRQPRVVNRYPWMNKVYKGAEWVRYQLELNAKGVGQGKDVFRELIVPSMIEKNATIHVQGFSGSKAFSMPGIKRAFSFANDMANATILHPIDTFLEAPMELIGFDANKIEAKARRLIGSSSLVDNISGKALSFINKPHMGLGYTSMKYGIPEYMLKFGAKRVLPAFMALSVFDVADKGLGVLATGDRESPGLMRGGAIWGFQQAALAYSAASDITGMTSWAKWQGSVAPGSTGLGVMAPGMSALLTFQAGKFLYNKGPSPFRNYIDDAFNAKRVGVGGRLQDALRDNVARNPWVQKAMRGAGYTAGAERLKLSNGQKLFRSMVKNPKMGIFMAASLPMIPFLPGFLGSDKSYRERRAEFRGEKEVAIRKYRGWLLSTSPFSGDKVNQYRQHASYLMSKDWEAAGGVIFPSFKDRALHRLSLGFYKPNILENYHAASQPVYSSSSAMENIPFIGPILAAMSNKILGGTTYHSPGPGTLQGEGAGIGIGGKIDGQGAAIAGGGEYTYAGDIDHMAKKWLSQTTDLAGFRGFMVRSAIQQATGQSQPGEFTPHLETGSKLYNQAHKLWGYQAGDITLVAGEFLRRVYQNPNHDAWMVNDIPNELMNASWIPKDSTYKDFTRGTTFDKIPMGWLLATRKGWEYQYGTQGQELDDYSDPIRMEILQQIAPYSPQLRATSQRVMGAAMAGELTPGEEQRYYETLDQVREIKSQIWAHANEGATNINTLEMTGLVDEINANTGKISIKGYNSPFSIAGVSFVEADIRKRLLDTRKYETASQLEADMSEVKERMQYILTQRVKVGSDLDFQIASPENFPTDELYNEDLTEALLDAGAPLANTGPIASHGIVQNALGGGSQTMSSYWSALTSDNTYFNKKLISQRDYISQYKGEQVYSKQVRLWTKPIEHLLKPLISQTLNRFGVDTIPSFTEDRRARQQYWDTIKYTKYKMLENQARRDGDDAAAQGYKNKWRNTMLGANPTDANPRDEMMALPKNERAYFNFIANEKDPERRAEIFKYLPESSKRIYRSIWAKKRAQAEGDQQALADLQESEGWDITAEERELYQSQTGGAVPMGDWIRAQVVADYADQNALPGAGWAGWAPNVDIENVQILSLKDDGEQIQDYGFFDNKLREAVFDEAAYGAAMYVNDLSHTPSKFYGSVIPSLLTGASRVELPTSAPNENSHIQIETNDYDKVVRKSNDKYAATLGDKYI